MMELLTIGQATHTKGQSGMMELLTTGQATHTKGKSLTTGQAKTQITHCQVCIAERQSITSHTQIIHRYQPSKSQPKSLVIKTTYSQAITISQPINYLTGSQDPLKHIKPLQQKLHNTNQLEKQTSNLTSSWKKKKKKSREDWQSSIEGR